MVRSLRRIVEADLGRPLSEVYQSFEEEPIASASVAQVHSAVGKPGRVIRAYWGRERLYRLANLHILIILTLITILYANSTKYEEILSPNMH